MSKMENCFPKPSSYENNFASLDFNVLESGEIQWTKCVNGQPQIVCSDEEVETLFDQRKKLIAEKKEQKSTNIEKTSVKYVGPAIVSASSGPPTSTVIRAVYPEPDFRRIAPGINDVANMLRIAKADFEIFINKRGRRKFKFDFIGKVYEESEKKRKNKKKKSAE